MCIYEGSWEQLQYIMVFVHVWNVDEFIKYIELTSAARWEMYEIKKI